MYIFSHIGLSKDVLLPIFSCPFELLLSDMCRKAIRVLNIGYRVHIRGKFSHISDIGGDIRDTCAYRAFISDTIYKEILITKSWFSVIDIIYLIKMM